jgi:hypothetical protein
MKLNVNKLFLRNAIMQVDSHNKRELITDDIRITKTKEKTKELLKIHDENKRKRSLSPSSLTQSSSPPPIINEDINQREYWCKRKLNSHNNLLENNNESIDKVTSIVSYLPSIPLMPSLKNNVNIESYVNEEKEQNIRKILLQQLMKKKKLNENEKEVNNNKIAVIKNYNDSNSSNSSNSNSSSSISCSNSSSYSNSGSDDEIKHTNKEKKS